MGCTLYLVPATSGSLASRARLTGDTCPDAHEVSRGPAPIEWLRRCEGSECWPDASPRAEIASQWRISWREAPTRSGRSWRGQGSFALSRAVLH